jgi:hypothetical protein
VGLARPSTEDDGVTSEEPKIGLPALTLLSQTSPQPLFFSWPGPNDPVMAEMPPWIVDSGGWRVLLFSSDQTYWCATPSDFQHESTPISESQCHLVNQPLLREYNFRIPPGSTEHWRRTYYGAFSGHILGTFGTDAMVVTINHGENKNQTIEGGGCDQNSVNPRVSCADCWSGVQPDGTWQDCLRAYHAFIGMTTYPFDESTGYGSSAIYRDLGPIAWPASGYYDAYGNRVAGHGLTHPSSIVHNGYLYVFYNDGSSGAEADGRGAGIKVVRAPIHGNSVEPQEMRSYFNGRFSEPALPAGLTPDNVAHYFTKEGGRSSNILPSVRGGNRFSVAKLRNTPYFISVVLENDGYLRLRLSQDLVNWGPSVTVTTVRPDGSEWWTTSRMLYPIFLDSASRTNTEIDPSNFSILGTSQAEGPHRVYAINLSIGLGGASGTISAAPNPCAIPAGRTACGSTISWNTNQAPHACVFVRETGQPIGTGQQFGCAASADSHAPWITADGFAFDLHESSSPSSPVIASLVVHGVPPATSPTVTGVFIVGSGIYYSNGSAYCWFTSWEHFVDATGYTSIDGIPELDAIPAGLSNDGPCAMP